MPSLNLTMMVLSTSDGSTSLSNHDAHPIYIRVVDKERNIDEAEFFTV